MAFGFGWTPCIGPILGSILALASFENNSKNGVMLLGFYSLGLAIPFIISGYAVQRFITLSKKLKNYISFIYKMGGIILLTTGILIVTNKLQSFGFYILEIFPFLSKIG
jgi:cytochrome c-type biogenesis protein